MVSNIEPFVVKNNEQNTMNNEQENLLQFIRGMARSVRVVVPAVPVNLGVPYLLS